MLNEHRSKKEDFFLCVYKIIFIQLCCTNSRFLKSFLKLLSHHSHFGQI